MIILDTSACIDYLNGVEQIKKVLGYWTNSILT